MRIKVLIAVLMSFTLSLSGCPEQEPAGSEDAPLTEATVAADNGGFTFSPDDVTIEVGGSITFENGSNHTATQVDQATWDADEATPMDGGFRVDFGATETITFDEAGTYWYVCEPHAGAGMKGVIVVIEATAT